MPNVSQELCSAGLSYETVCVITKTLSRFPAVAYTFM